jgi:hypothetical protein
MLTAITAIIIVLSIGIPIAHALDAFRVSDVYLFCETHSNQKQQRHQPRGANVGAATIAQCAEHAWLQIFKSRRPESRWRRSRRYPDCYSNLTDQGYCAHRLAESRKPALVFKWGS